MKKLSVLLAAVLLAVALAGCSQPAEAPVSPSPEAAVTATPEPTPEPTATPEPTPESSPSPVDLIDSFHGAPWGSTKSEVASIVGHDYEEYDTDSMAYLNMDSHGFPCVSYFYFDDDGRLESGADSFILNVETDDENLMYDIVDALVAEYGPYSYEFDASLFWIGETNSLYFSLYDAPISIGGDDYLFGALFYSAPDNIS